MTHRSKARPAVAAHRPIHLLAAALALLAAPLAQAQSGVTLACSAPTSTGNTANLTTAAGVWGVDIGAGVTPAVAFYYGGPWVAGPAGTGGWIGSVSVGNPTSVTYSVQVNATDPNIVPASARLSYQYVVDNLVTGASWNGTALPFDGTVWFGSTTPFSQAPMAVALTSGSNLLRFDTMNAGNPYGLNAVATLTFDCLDRAAAAAASAQAVPVDDPLALAGVTAALAVAGAAVLRRRRRG